MDKLKVKDLKATIKTYKFQKPITGLKKAELKAYVTHLQQNGTLKSSKLSPKVELEGEGILDLFRSQKLELSNTAKNLLNKYGDIFIKNIKLFTEEVAGVSHLSANVATMGALTKFTKKTGTKLFHIGCIITLANGQELKFEKEEIPMLLTKVSLSAAANIKNVPLKGKLITLRQLINNTEKYMTPQKFYKYEGLKNNCQDFMMGMLKGNNLENPELIKWGKQDITHLVNEVPTINEKIMNGITGLKARFRSVTGYGADIPNFQLRNQEIKDALNKSKNVQTKEYTADIKKKNDDLSESMIKFLLEHTKMDRKKLIKMSKDNLNKLYSAEYNRHKEEIESQMIESRESQGFIYDKIKNELVFQGKHFKIDDKQGMDDAYNKYFDKMDAENSYCYSLGQYAYDLGYGWDEDHNKWYMINHKLGIRQYIDNFQQAQQMSQTNFSHPREVWKSAFRTSNHMAGRDSFWDNSMHAYKKFSQDLYSSIDDFTGGIFSQVLSLAPAPFLPGVELLKGLSKFMTGSETGNIGDVLERVDLDGLSQFAGGSKDKDPMNKVLTFRCQLSHTLGKNKLSDSEIVNHLEKLHGSGALKDMFANVLSKVANAVLPKRKNDIVKSGSLVPDTKILFKMNESSYSKDAKDIEPYHRVLKTPYLTVYKDDQTVVVAVRGTDVKDSKDLMADIAIALGALKSTPRFKNDVEELRKLRQNPELQNLYWIGTGHSLGSALCDEFLKLGLISEAVTFNGAVSKEFYNVNNKNRRIYLKNDPLYLIMGRNTKYHEVRDTKIDITKAHSLKNFEGGSNHGSVLYAVIVHKPMDLKEARKLAQEYIKEPKKRYFQENKVSYTFRKYPKQKFEPSSFVTENQEGKASLIFGELKNRKDPGF